MNKKGKKVLMAIDEQYDFINGSLAVNGAEDKTKKLAYHLHKNDGEYALKIFTQDWHPFNHCSFKENGGVWPMHCLQESKGAAIYDDVLKSAYDSFGKNLFLKKGFDKDKESYSVFYDDVIAEYIKSEIEKVKKKYGDYHIDVCGIAKDYCVKETLKGLLKIVDGNKITVLNEFTPSITDDNALNELVDKYKIKIVD